MKGGVTTKFSKYNARISTYYVDLSCPVLATLTYKYMLWCNKVGAFIRDESFVITKSILTFSFLYEACCCLANAIMLQSICNCTYILVITSMLFTTTKISFTNQDTYNLYFMLSIVYKSQSFLEYIASM